MNRNFAFIFARGGSKGVPRKNIKELAGKPLIFYPIQLAKSLGVFEKVFVSTDDHEIATISSKFGASIIERPSYLSGDTASEWLAWRHAVQEVTSKYGNFDVFVSLPTTSPLRNEVDVRNAIGYFLDNKFDVVISVTKSKRSPWFNMVKYTNDNRVELLGKLDESVERRQDAPISYDITTVAYVTSPKFIFSSGGIFCGDIGAIEIPEERALDIDSKFDFEIADLIMRNKKE